MFRVDVRPFSRPRGNFGPSIFKYLSFDTRFPYRSMQYENKLLGFSEILFVKRVKGSVCLLP